MKLPDFLQFEPLQTLRQIMSAELVDAIETEKRPSITAAELEIMVTKGKEIDIDELHILPDGTLAYKDSRVLLHIRDVAAYYGTDKVNLPKFHFADCKTLETMRNRNRIERYVVSIRTDGKFTINIIDGNYTDTKLENLIVCMNCLDRINYDEYKSKPKLSKQSIRDNFSIDDYFKEFSRNLILAKPRYDSSTAPLNNYPHNWDKISREYRESIQYECEECKISLSSFAHQKYMHVHHRNGQKHDCLKSNLKGVCIYCHANEDMHGHLKNSPDYINFLNIRRQIAQPANDPYTRASIKSSTSNELSDLIRTYDLKVADFTKKGGAYWIVHDFERDEIGIQLAKAGLKYKSGRGWWTAESP